MTESFNVYISLIIPAPWTPRKTPHFCTDARVFSTPSPAWMFNNWTSLVGKVSRNICNTAASFVNRRTDVFKRLMKQIDLSVNGTFGVAKISPPPARSFTNDLKRDSSRHGNDPSHARSQSNPSLAIFTTESNCTVSELRLHRGLPKTAYSLGISSGFWQGRSKETDVASRFGKKRLFATKVAYKAVSLCHGFLLMASLWGDTSIATLCKGTAFNFASIRIKPCAVGCRFDREAVTYIVCISFRFISHLFCSPLHPHKSSQARIDSSFGCTAEIRLFSSGTTKSSSSNKG